MDLAKHWRLKGARYRLEGQRHTRSGQLRFPAQPPLPGEKDDDWETITFSGKGEVYSFTVLRQAPDGFEGQTPYPVALVRLAEGPLVTAQLADVDEADVQIGMPVELVTRRLRDLGPEGLLVYGYKFRPLLESASQPA
jgi:hypothetical protein